MHLVAELRSIMAYFNEDNTVEQMLINAAGKCGWIYVEPQEVPRLPDEVLVTEWLVTALRRLNPITEDQAAQVVYLFSSLFWGNKLIA